MRHVRLKDDDTGPTVNSNPETKCSYETANKQSAKNNKDKFKNIKNSANKKLASIRTNFSQFCR